MTTKPTSMIRAAVLGCALATASVYSQPVSAGQSLIRSAQSWSIQFSGDVSRIIKSNADVVVVDVDHGGNASRFKTKPDGGRRAAIAYLSVGEAETYRSYYKSCCAGKSPAWLTTQTQGWAGNYVVKYWDPAWKAITAARVREIFAKGYDGLYLDRIDTWEKSGKRAEMIQFVREIASQARGIKGDAAIIVQNGEELLTDSGYIAAFDAIAKEDLFHGIKHDGSRNTVGAVNASVSLLNKVKAQGKKVFVIEYLSGDRAASVAAEIRKQGFVPNFAGRNLNN